jgi:S1-C subfamily serine protease
MYAAGNGVSKDDQQAFYWYKKSAEQGNTRAQYKLGVAYALGQGIARDFQQAYFWFLLGSAKDDTFSIEGRDGIESYLSPDQRSQAQYAVRTWKPATKGSTTSPEPKTVTPTLPSPPLPLPVLKLSSTGSGFKVGSNLLVTNQHVVDGCARLQIDGKTPARLIVSDKNNDLALISFEGVSSTVATIRTGRIQVGEGISVVGFPLRAMLNKPPLAHDLHA